MTIRRRYFLLALCAGAVALTGAFAAAHVSDPNVSRAAIYVVRHAEKSDADGSDPGLSEAGKARADDLARALRHCDIKTAIATPYKRTRETLIPLAVERDIEIVDLPAGDFAAIAQRALSQREHGGVVIAGHSNTVGRTLRALGVDDAPGDLLESDYDNLFIVSFCGGAPTLQRLHYGADDGVE